MNEFDISDLTALFLASLLLPAIILTVCKFIPLTRLRPKLTYGTCGLLAASTPLLILIRPASATTPGVLISLSASALCVLFFYWRNTRAAKSTQLPQSHSGSLTPISKTESLEAAQRPISQFASASSGTSTSAPESANYFARHWRGDLSLPVSYWVNLGLITGGVSLGVTLLLALPPVKALSLRAVSLLALLAILASLAVWLWAVVGVWRSADRHPGRGGSVSWASVAKTMVIFEIIWTVSKMVTGIGPVMTEYAQILVGRDPIGSLYIKISPNGQSLIIDGMLREGSAARIEEVLNSVSGIRTLELNSRGGRLAEARHIAQVVKEHNLNTFVEFECDSACTYVLLAGRNRAATPNAKIGFHQASTAGTDADVQRAASEQMQDDYRAAHLPQSFIVRVALVPASQIWYPTQEELFAANVLTVTSLTR